MISVSLSSIEYIHFTNALQLTVNFIGDIQLYIPIECHKCKEPEWSEGTSLEAN